MKTSKKNTNKKYNRKSSTRKSNIKLNRKTKTKKRAIYKKIQKGGEISVNPLLNNQDIGYVISLPLDKDSANRFTFDYTKNKIENSETGDVTYDYTVKITDTVYNSYYEFVEPIFDSSSNSVYYCLYDSIAKKIFILKISNTFLGVFPYKVTDTDFELLNTQIQNKYSDNKGNTELFLTNLFNAGIVLFELSFTSAQKKKSIQTMWASVAQKKSNNRKGPNETRLIDGRLFESVNGRWVPKEN
jgi:hypothetical protein